MTIPQILDYEVPECIELNRAPLTWKIEAGKSALLIHDMQNYFLRRYESGPFMKKLVDNIASIRSECHRLDIPTFYTAQPGNQPRSDRGLLLDFWGAGMPDDAQAKAIVHGLEPVPGRDILLVKHRYSAFAKSDFLDRLEQIKRNQLIVCGVYAHIGCLVTATEAFMADIQPFVIADALGDFSLRHHKIALEHMAHCSSVVLSTEKLLSALREQ